MAVEFILLLVSSIIIFGYIGELVFKKAGVPDSLFLIALGFVIGPAGLGIINPDSLSVLAPLFITVTLVFLLFDGALAIDLKSFAEGIGPGIKIAIFNFLISTLIISAILVVLKFEILEAAMVGFCLGGVSSAFTIPVLKKIEPRKTIYSILTLEAALTDVLAIVLALTMIELKQSSVFLVKNVLSEIASLFAIAGMIGICAGFLWIFLEQKFVDKDKYHMVTVAYVFLVYLITEYLGGNGAIAAMFLGIVLANSKILMEILSRIRRKRKPSVKVKGGSDRIEPVVTKRERMFYDEISFFLKTFFFVYIGLLLNIRNSRAVGLGIAIAVALMLFRNLSSLLTRSYCKVDRMLINSLFARGIASAVIILIAVRRGMTSGSLLFDTVYVVITATILFSSLRIYIFDRYRKRQESIQEKSS
jgi:cell volume regulation protein A